ncbi:MAG: AtzE family amidohydrolase [Magnetovibrionaceae bacterium]
MISAIETARAIKAGEIKAGNLVEETLAHIEADNPKINAFTDVTAERARAEARAVDEAVSVGRDPGPLAGVPFAVKNLFDLEGLVTRAGSKIARENSPARRDADLVERLKAAGGICLGALNMGEFAYDFTGENAHDGDCCNPHDPSCMTGGSSSGSGAAVGAGLVPITLGSDTNGSLRVPASLCGVYSLRPTYGRLSRGGSFPFVDGLDTVGPFARSLDDLAAVYDVLQGPTNRDHACRNLPPAPISNTATDTGQPLRLGVLRGWFETNCDGEALARRDRLLSDLPDGVTLVDINLDQAEFGRAAAFLMTQAESSALHLPTLKARATDYDPDTRDRFLAGALLPAAWAQKAQIVRKWWLAEILACFQNVDVLITPATPFAAPKRGQRTILLNGEERPTRPFLGLLAQPFSAVGLPVVTLPTHQAGESPIGLQVVAAPWREGKAFAAAQLLGSSA